MKEKNKDVIRFWHYGCKRRNHRGSLWSDGESLYSYNLKIGHRASDGTTILADYTSPGGDFRSQTTSCHVGLVRRSGVDTVMHPHAFVTSDVLNG